MKKTRGFLLAAGISLALAFTISCSDDGGGGDNTPGGSSSGAPPAPSTTSDGYQIYNIPSVQVYDRSTYPTPKYTGSGEVVFDQDDEVVFKVGDIKDGKLSLDLKEIRSFNFFESGYQPVFFSVSDCWRLELYGSASETLQSQDDVKARTLFLYASDGRKVSTDYGEGELDLKKGWNIAYRADGNIALAQPPNLTWNWNWYIRYNCEN